MQDVDSSLRRLLCLLRREEEPSEASLRRARRLLRPTTRDVQRGELLPAVRSRLRSHLMTATNGSGDGKSSAPEKVKAFEKEVDLLRRRHVKHWPSFLTFLESLVSSLPSWRGTDLGEEDVSFSIPSVVSDQQEKSVKPHNQPSGFFHKEVSSSSAPIPAPPSSFQSESLLPYGPPPILSDESIQSINNELVWVSRDTELLLIRDLLLIFQGINSPHIKLDGKTQTYIIHPEIAIPSPVRDIVLCMCEVGWLFIKVKTYIDRVEDCQGRGGLIAQAFAFSLQNALNDYYRLLAVLEQELSRSSIPELEKSKEGTNGLTLLRLRAWMQEPLDRMSLMARITDCAVPLAGGGLISRIHGHSFHGDDNFRNFVITMLKSVSVPLYHMITRWVLHGEIVDPQGEFFVSKNNHPDGSRGYRSASKSQHSVSADFLWHHYYKLNMPMLPTFISAKLAHKILVVGKSINFMKACLQHGGRDEKSRGEDKRTKPKPPSKFTPMKMPDPFADEDDIDVNETASDKEEEKKADSETPEPEDSSVNKGALVTGSGHQEDKSHREGSDKEDTDEDYIDSTILLSEDFEESLRSACHSYGDESALSSQVHAIAGIIESRLLNMVLKKFNLFTHLAALKKFMLLGQGDFVTCLMDTVGGELKRRANQLFRHNLTGLLDGALRSCNAQYEPAYVLDRLGVRLLEPSPGDSGWEVFSLDYAIDPPLAAVIHSEAISKYRIAFHMLWRLKRVEWSLSGAWRNLFTYHHTRGHFFLTKLKPIMHRCAVERGKMTHFINSLNNFLMFEVVETAWVSLVSGVEQATCLDDIIRCHDAYLEDIQQRALLSEEFEGLNMQIQLVLQAILRFCNLEETMVGDALSSAARKRHDGQVGWCPPAHSEEVREAGSQVVGSGTVDGVPGYIIARLEEAAQDYEKQFDKMIHFLQQQGEKCGHLMRFLTFRLDLDSGQGPSKALGWISEGSEESKSSRSPYRA